ncbi:MAG: hypothetical protein MPN21_26270 [Thermoanaerobaculia bacterium]|nr:hypothetical protein [Thermoanaerobaculia bacterium]
MSRTTTIALIFLVAGGLLVVRRLVQYTVLRPVHQPIHLDDPGSYSASFVARHGGRYEIGLSTEAGRGLPLEDRCPTTPERKCVAGLRPVFTERCVAGGNPGLELTAWVKTEDRTVAANCSWSTYDDIRDWQEIWWIETEPGREYEIELTVVSDTPEYDRFEPALSVLVDRFSRGEAALSYALFILGAVSLGAIGLIVLVSGPILRWLRRKDTVVRATG